MSYADITSVPMSEADVKSPELGNLSCYGTVAVERHGNWFDAIDGRGVSVGGLDQRRTHPFAKEPRRLSPGVVIANAVVVIAQRHVNGEVFSRSRDRHIEESSFFFETLGRAQGHVG